MRNILAILLMISIASCLIVSVSCATIPTIEEKTRSFVINVPGKSKIEIYNQSLEWISSAFNSSRVIDYQNEDAGRIVCKYKSLYKYFTFEGNIDVQLSIDVKNGRARLVFVPTTLTALTTAFRGSTRDPYDYELEDVFKQIERVRYNYRKYLTEKQKDNSDW